LNASLLLLLTTFPKLYKVCNIENNKPIKHFEPINLDPQIEEVEKFLTKIPPNSRVLVLFTDPKGVYNNLFSGYRHSLELINYTALNFDICTFPNWQAILENNNFDSHGFWPSNDKELKELRKIWKFDYLISTDSK
jgi:hypothetical protein